MSLRSSGCGARFEQPQALNTPRRSVSDRRGLRDADELRANGREANVRERACALALRDGHPHSVPFVDTCT